MPGYAPTPRLKNAPWRIREAAFALRCSDQHVSDRIAAGQIAHTMLGEMKLITDAEMQRLTGLDADQLVELWNDIAAARAAAAAKPRVKGKAKPALRARRAAPLGTDAASAA
jgi:hypothetical protein